MKRNYELYHRIKELLEARKYNQTEIAKMLNTTRNLVKTVVRENKLGLGRGPVKFWEYKGMTQEFAYIVGAYLTDGSITSGHFKLSVKDKEFADFFEKCMNEYGMLCKNSFDNDFYIVTYCSVMFEQWIKSECDGKNKIPDYIKNSSKECKMSFISALIDGDGTVRKKRTIRICGTFQYILQLEKFLNDMGMTGTTSCQKEFTINKKNYYTVYINPNQFVENGGKCAISRKQNRIEGKDFYLCPICNQYTKHTKEAKTCQQCYFNR